MEDETTLVDLFSTKIKVYNIFGRYSFDQENTNRIQSCLVFLSFVSPTLFGLSLAGAIFLEELELAELFGSFAFCVNVIQFVIKCTCFHLKKKVFYQMEKKMVYFPRRYNLLNKNIYVIKNTFDECTKATSVYRANIIVGLISFFLIPLLAKDHELTFPGYFPYNKKTTVGFWSGYLFQLVTLTTVAHFNGTIDITSYKLVTVGCALIKVLLKELSNINVVQKDRVKENFVKCLKFHIDVLEMSQLIEEFCTYIAFAQVLGSFCILAITSVELLFIPLETAVGPIFFLIVILLQTAMYCVSGNEFANLSRELGTACYKSKWYSTKLEVQKLIVIFMERVKRPVYLTAGKFATLNLALFTAIVKTSYSYFAVLKKTYSD